MFINNPKTCSSSLRHNRRGDCRKHYCWLYIQCPGITRISSRTTERARVTGEWWNFCVSMLITTTIWPFVTPYHEQGSEARSHNRTHQTWRECWMVCSSVITPFLTISANWQFNTKMYHISTIRVTLQISVLLGVLHSSTKTDWW